MYCIYSEAGDRPSIELLENIRNNHDHNMASLPYHTILKWGGKLLAHFYVYKYVGSC